MSQLKDSALTTRLRGAFIDQPDSLYDIAQSTLQRPFEEEITLHLNADPHERTEDRAQVSLRLPSPAAQDARGDAASTDSYGSSGTFKTELFDRRQRSEKALVLSLMPMYLEGVSTKKVKDITEVLCGFRGVVKNAPSFSKSTVSRMAGPLNTDLVAWREQRLEGVAYPYLMVDARYEHARVDGRVVSQGVLIVL